MARFDKVSRLSYECFKNKPGYFGWIRVDKSENYIGVVTCKCGDTVTDILYNPRQKSARVMTFDPCHLEEDRFAELCKNIGVDAKVEYQNRDRLPPTIIARSPSGRVDDEQFELMKDFSEV